MTDCVLPVSVTAVVCLCLIRKKVYHQNSCSMIGKHVIALFCQNTSKHCLEDRSPSDPSQNTILNEIRVHFFLCQGFSLIILKIEGLFQPSISDCRKDKLRRVGFKLLMLVQIKCVLQCVYKAVKLLKVLSKSERVCFYFSVSVLWVYQHLFSSHFAMLYIFFYLLSNLAMSRTWISPNWKSTGGCCTTASRTGQDDHILQIAPLPKSKYSNRYSWKISDIVVYEENSFISNNFFKWNVHVDGCELLQRTCAECLRLHQGPLWVCRPHSWNHWQHHAISACHVGTAPQFNNSDSVIIPTLTVNNHSVLIFV